MFAVDRLACAYPLKTLLAKSRSEKTCRSDPRRVFSPRWSRSRRSRVDGAYHKSPPLDQHWLGRRDAERRKASRRMPPSHRRRVLVYIRRDFFHPDAAAGERAARDGGPGTNGIGLVGL